MAFEIGDVDRPTFGGADATTKTPRSAHVHMVKMVQLLVRRDDYTHEEFVERWRGEHADLAKDLPNLRTYATSVPSDPERSSHDGVVELYFEDMAALSEAFESEVGRAVQADAAEFADLEAGETLYVEEQVEYEA